ncbi:hypothetical protein [Alteromonas macleodii]|uniref:hypothetical protein n=1 Tax=Alteromonas macleodii TaxID=28108 RepID=UPI00313ED9BD
MSNQGRSCAFCGDRKNLTREHIFPNGVIKRFEHDMVSYSDKSEKIFKSDLVVKDVCEYCNNVILSELDSSFIQLYEDFIRTPLQPGSNAEFKFDYNLLLRELLKISFNSARASADGFKSVKALKKYVPYILGEVNEAPDVMLRLQIVTSSKKINTQTNEFEGLMEAELLRSCKIDYRGPKHSFFMIRLVALNSFWFYLIFPIRKVSASRKETFLSGFLDLFNLKGVP